MDQSQRVQAAKNIFKKRKVFNDPIHGHIELHPVCVRIVDTPQFQRLRNIKQLDACYLVYPGASHNRFEHSLRTCHLAGKLLRTISERQLDQNITEKDILCVEIAGLCHDLGQGPFSHVFEKRFMPKMKKKFTHEGTAKKMFEFMLEDNGGELKKDIQDIIRECQMPDFRQLDEQDFLFIKEMIDEPKENEDGSWPYEGRDESKSFMYEIVANKRNEIDVDKWDYLARDSYMLGIKNNFDHNRCFMSARVITSNGHDDRVARKQICYRDKDAPDLYDMFYTRLTLHKRAYQHKTHCIIGMMICDALVEANDAIEFVGKEGKPYSISDTVNDMKAFTMLTDDIFHIILNAPANGIVLSSDIQNNNEDASSSDDTISLGSSSENTDRKTVVTEDERIKANKANKAKKLQNAKKILNDIVNRKLYKCIERGPIKHGKFDEKTFKDFMSDLKPVEENECVFDVVNLNYGMEDRDPVSEVRFYRKENDETAVRLDRSEVSFVLPETFAEQIVRIYCKKRSANGQALDFILKIKAKLDRLIRDLKQPRGQNQDRP